jgi:gliding motility associated protien GldN
LFNIKVMKRLILISLSLLLCGEFYAQQDNENNVLDGAFIKETAPTRRVIPYTHIREADVEYYKRVWRDIDLRQKINHPLYYPIVAIREIGYERLSLFDVIKKGVTEGTISAYDEDGVGGQFRKRLLQSEALQILSPEVTTSAIDFDTGLEIDTTYADPVNPSNIFKYRLKEDWFFDRERSVMEVRIIGILPIINKLNTSTDQMEMKGLFWIYFPEARYVFANHEVYNSKNDGSRLTFEDYFRKRIFSGYIIRETNVYDNRDIEKQFTSGIDRLLEAEKIQREIINHEHDMWQY